MSAAGLPAWSEVDGERAEFEAWAKPRVFSLVVLDDDPDEYKELETASAWEAWQARAAMGESSQARAEQTCFGAGDVVRIRDIALAVFHGCSQEARDVIEWYHSSLLVETERDRAALASSVQAVQEQAAGVAVPAGYKLVPVVPTPEMIAALAGPGRILPAYVGAKEKSDARIADRYRAMLAASPAATAPAGAGMVPADLIAKLTRIHAALSNACRQYGEVGSRDVDVADWNHRMHEAVRAVGSLLADQPLQAAPPPAPAPAATTQAQGQDERAAFEATCLKSDPDAMLNRRRDGTYIDPELGPMWWAWQARAALSAQAEPQVAAEPYGFESGLVQLLNEARCLSSETVGNRELAGRVMKYIRMYWAQPATSPAQPQLSEAEIDALMPEPDGYAAIAPEGTHSIVVPPQDFAKVNGYSIFTREQVHAAVRAAMQQKGGAV